MRQPKFKFELEISELVNIRKGYKVDASGTVVPDAHWSCTDYIGKSGFRLSEDLYGLDVTIAVYEEVGPSMVLDTIHEYSTFGPVSNTGFEFDDSNKKVIVSVRHENIYLDPMTPSVHIDRYNFVSYRHLVHPVFSKLKKVYERDGTEMYMRAKLQGDLSFTTGAFDKLASVNMNCGVILRIYKKDPQSGQYSIFYVTQRFTKAGCTFDYDKRSVKVPTDPDDQYTKILSAMNTEFDLQKINCRWCRAKYKIPPLKQFYIYGSKQVTNMIGESFFNTDVEFPDTDQQDYFTILRGLGFARTDFFTEIRYHQTIPILTGGEHYDVSFHCRSSFVYPGAGPYPSGLTPHTYAFAPSYIPYKLHYNSTSGQIEIQDYATGAVIAASINNTATRLTSEGLIGLNIYQGGQAVGVITSVLQYDIFQRTLYYNDNPTAQDLITDEDFAYSGSVYNSVESSFPFCPQILVTADLSDQPGEFALMKSPINYFTNRALPHGGLHERFIPVCSDAWSGISFWVSGSVNYNNFINAFGFDFVNDRCVTVISAIRAILGKVDPSIIIADTADHSEFLYGLFNPLGLPPVIPILTHSSNITAGAFSQWAQRGKVKLKDLLDLLRNSMRVYWYIDENNKMHFEHVTWFLHGGTYGQRVAQLDITSVKDAFNGKVFDTGRGSLKYDTGRMFSSIELSADTDTTDASATVKIDVYDRVTRGCNADAVGLGDFKVNLDYLFAMGSSESHEDNMAFILALKESGSNTDGLYSVPRVAYTNADMLCDCGERYTIRPLNTYAMPRFLMNYHMYDFAGRDLSSKAYVVNGLSKIRTQTISIPAEFELQPYGFIMTRFGRGLIDKITTDFDSQYAEISLLHDAGDYAWNYEEVRHEEDPIYDVVKEGTMNVWENGYFYITGGPYYALYSIPCLADLLRTIPRGIGVALSGKMVPYQGPPMPNGAPLYVSAPMDSAVSPASTYFAAVASYDATSGKWSVKAGLANCNFGTGTYIMQAESCDLDVAVGEEFGIKMYLRLIGNNVRMDIWIASESGHARYSVDTPFTSRLSGNVQPITLAANSGNPWIRYKAFKVEGR